MMQSTDASEATDPFTIYERDAWDKLNEAARAFLQLPAEDDHPMEKEEAANTIHILQRMLMARPTRRLLRERGEMR